MNKKWGGYWLIIMLASIVIISCSFAAAANKVVGVPLGGGSGAQNESVKVFDDDGQYLGLFVGNNGPVIEIFVPTVGKILAIEREGGRIKTSNGYWYYTDTACTDGPYLLMNLNDPSGDNLGILYSNDESNCDFFSSYPISGAPGQWSRKSNNGSGSCESFFSDRMASPITTYTNAEVGFTAPVKFPLQFVTE